MPRKPVTTLLAAVAPLLLAAPAASGWALPEGTIPPDHPCLVPEERFEPLARADGVDTRVTRAADGPVVVRTSAPLPAPPGRVLEVLSDVEGWPRFIGRIRSLAWLGGARPAVHIVFDAPWPFSDRDYGIALAVAPGDGGGGTVFWESVTEGLPPPGRGVVRVRNVRGGFAVTPGAAAGTSTLTYSELDSFALTLPAFARDAARTRGPREIVKGLASVLAAPRSMPRPASPRRGGSIP